MSPFSKQSGGADKEEHWSQVGANQQGRDAERVLRFLVVVVPLCFLDNVSTFLCLLMCFDNICLKQKQWTRHEGPG